MTLKEEMERHGFMAMLQDGGQEWYTKEMPYKGENAFVAVTDDSGLALPKSKSKPVLVRIYSPASGAEPAEVQRFKSLSAYLDDMNRREDIDYSFLSNDRIWPPNLAPASFKKALVEVLTRIPDGAYEVIRQHVSFVVENPKVIAVKDPVLPHGAFRNQN